MNFQKSFRLNWSFAQEIFLTVITDKNGCAAKYSDIHIFQNSLNKKHFFEK